MTHKVLIIGAGKQGAFCDAAGSGNEHKVISHAKAFKMHGGFELVGFYDTNIKLAREAATEWEVGWFNDIEEAVVAGANIISICTPDDTHYDILDKVCNHNPLLVLCEKPITTDVRQAVKIVAQYETRGIPILVNYTRRFIPELQLFKKRVENGEFGDFLYGWGGFNRGWCHTATHMIDFVLWVLGDTAKFRIQEIDNAHYRVFQIHLFFETLYWKMISGETVDPIFNLHTWYVADNIYNYLNNGEPLLCTSKDALQTLSVCEQMKEIINGG